MKKIGTIVLFFILMNSFGQPQKKIMAFLSPEFSKTLQDGTKPNNEQGIGIALNAIFMPTSKFSPLVTVADDFVFSGDKVFRTYNGLEMQTISNVLNLFAGVNYNPVKNIFISFASGASLINNQILLGIKPSIGIYFPENKRWMAKFSYLDIFNRNSGIIENYSALSFSVGIRLF